DSRLTVAISRRIGEFLTVAGLMSANNALLIGASRYNDRACIIFSTAPLRVSASAARAEASLPDWKIPRSRPSAAPASDPTGPPRTAPDAAPAPASAQILQV